MREIPLVRDGKIILRLVERDDGTVTLRKPLPLKPDHIYQQTGAPGWDKRYVDQVFEAGIDGTLEYVQGMSKFVISIETLRKHAYTSKHPIYGEQYHCEKQWYEEHLLAITEPVRGGGEIKGTTYTRAPAKLEFGKVLPCSHCRGSGVEPGKRTANSCTTCLGMGVVPWRPTTSSR